jgi:hypothetical protein
MKQRFGYQKGVNKMNKLEIESLHRIKTALSKIPSRGNTYDFGGALSAADDFNKGVNLAMQAMSQMIYANTEEDPDVKQEYKDDIIPYVEALEAFIQKREHEKWGNR